MFTNSSDRRQSEQSIYIPNYPPPPIPYVPIAAYDAPPTSRLDAFKERFVQFVAHRQPTSEDQTRERDAHDNLKLCETTDEVRQCYELIDELKVECASLYAEINGLSEIEWNEKITILQAKQKRMAELAAKYNDPDTQTAIETKWRRRQERRSRIRKRKTETKGLRKRQIDARNEKHRLIDEWFQENARAVEKQRQRAEDDRCAEQILSDVKRMKCDAIKNIQLMESLIELHRVRRVQKTLDERCERELVDEMSKLKSEWMAALADYDQEEHELRKSFHTNDLEDQWRQILFVASDGVNRPDDIDSVHDLDDLIRIRSAWDAFISMQTHSFGSSIPSGWVTPSKNPSAKWDSFRF